MITTPANQVLATIGNEICLLTGDSFDKRVLVSLPQFGMQNFPFVVYFCANSVGIADLRDGKYNSIVNNKGNNPYNLTSKLQLIEVAADGSLLIATTEIYERLAGSNLQDQVMKRLIS